MTEAIFSRTKVIGEYRIVDADDIDLDTLGDVRLGEATITVIDPVADYAALMETLIDFDAVAAPVPLRLPDALRRDERG